MNKKDISLDIDKDFVIESYRASPLDLSSPYIGVKVTHNRTGLIYCTNQYSTYTANKIEAVYQILQLVRHHYDNNDIIPFKHFDAVFLTDKEE